MRLLAVSMIVALSFIRCAVAGDMAFMTHVIRPLSWQDSQKQYRGLAYELSAMTMSRLGYKPQAIETYPFARALRLVETTDDQVLFPVARIPERENLVKWVGPLISNGVYFYQRKDAKTNIRTIEDLKKLPSIGVGRSNASMALLAKQGFRNLYPVSDETQAIQMLALGHVDAVAVGELVILAMQRSERLGPVAFRRIDIKLYDSDLYMAFSKNVSDQEIQRWQRGLTEVRKERFQTLYDHYIK